MYRTVDQRTGITDDLGTVGRLQTGKVGVDALADTEMHPALVAKQTGFHAEKVVALRFLELRIATSEQKFASLEIVVGIKFIAD